MLKQVREQRQTVGVLFPTLIASDTVEPGSTKLKIKATGHLAETGDIIRVTKASNLGVEYYALSVDTDYINLNAQLPCDVQSGDSFDIYRLDSISSTSLPVSSTPKTAAFDDDGTYTYIGLAAPGSLTSAAVWRIIRMTNADDRMIYADGNSNYDNVWDDHLSLSYS